MKNIVFVALCAVLFVGCTATKIHNNQGKVSHKVYNGAYAQCASDNEAERYLQERLNYYLEKSRIANKDLKIECSIQKFDKGNRVLRYMIGFGAGKAVANIKFVLKENDVAIASFEGLTELGGGFFGGDAMNTLELNARDIVNFVKKNYIKE